MEKHQGKMTTLLLLLLLVINSRHNLGRRHSRSAFGRANPMRLAFAPFERREFGVLCDNSESRRRIEP